MGIGNRSEVHQVAKQLRQMSDADKMATLHRMGKHSKSLLQDLIIEYPEFVPFLHL